MGKIVKVSGPLVVATGMEAAIEAIPAIGGGASSVIVEIHIHLEGNAAPETVQALEDYVRRGELRDVITGVMEDIQTDARRGAYG